MKYLLEQPTAARTPQSKPIPGREKVMERNAAGGYAFSADMWDRLERFIILGSQGGTYYIGQSDLTKQNVDNVRACIATDGPRTVQAIKDISASGRAPKNDPALYALALAASGKDARTTESALAVLPAVARTGTDLFTFTAFVDTMRGWGPTLRRAIGQWYTSKTPVERMGYQLVKYQQRNGWSHRDLFRLSHVPMNSAATRWVLGADTAERSVVRYKGKEALRTDKYPAVSDELPAMIKAFEEAKKADHPCPHCKVHREAGYQPTTCEDCQGSGVIRGNDEKAIIRLIRDHSLTREMIPTEHQKSIAVWDALLDKMPMGAMIRTLGRMGAVGLIAPFSEASKTVVSRLLDRERLRKSRVHPIKVLAALLTYKQGHGEKGKLSWTAVPQVVDALNDAFYAAFEFVEPTNKRFCLGIDVSGSMTGGSVAGMDGLTPNMGAAAMAMLIARTEPNHFIGGFSDRFIDLGISKSMRLDQAMKKCQMNYGGTDASIPITYALDRKWPVDAFVCVSDGESWAGSIHASQAITRYRQTTGIDAKVIYINMVSNMTSLKDPADAGSLDVVGFDASVPAIISGFLGAKVETETDDSE